MKLRTMFLAGTSLLAMTAHAHADPISTLGGIFIQGILAAGIATGPLATAIGTALAYATTIGAAVGLSLVGRQTPGKIDPGKYKNNFSDNETSEIRAVGRTRNGGLKAFGNTNGYDRYRLILHSKGRASAVEEHFLGGRPVVVDDDTGAVQSPPYARDGGSYVYVVAKAGDGSETAWPDLIAKFPNLWTSAHRVRGIAQTLVHYISPGLTDKKFLKLYQSGAPDYERVQRGEPVYDPRDANQNPADPDTWEWSDNGILCAVHVMRSDQSLTADDFDWVLITLEAVKADIGVTTKTGTEKRSRCWGVWPSENKRSDTMSQVLDSIGGEVKVTDEGKIWIRLIDDDRPSEIAFTAADAYDLTWKAGPEAVERPNICRPKYYAPERNYAMTEIDMNGITWASVDSEVLAYGDKYLDVELPFCPSAAQAQRIARRKFLMARADTGTINTNMVGLAAWGLSVADIELPDIDETVTAAIEPPKIDDERGRVEIPFTVIPAMTPWNPDTDEAAPPEAVPDLSYTGDVPQPDRPAKAVIITYPDGSHELRVAYADDLGTYDTIEANYRTYSGGLPDPWQAMTEEGSFAYAPGDLTGDKIDCRVRVFDDDGNGSLFSDLLTVASLGTDNEPPAAPAVVSGGASTVNGDATLDVTVSVSDVSAVSLRCTSDKGFDSGDVVIRPGQPQHFADNYHLASAGSVPVTWTIRAYAGDGTAGAALTLTATAIGTGGG